VKLETKYPEVFVEINEETLYYKIIQVISGKNKVRRYVVGRPVKTSRKGNPKCDMFGNQLYNRFKNIEDAKRHAINFVENYLVLK